LALDEPNDNDEVYDISGFKYVVDKELVEQAKPIKIDFMGMGFNITSSIVFEKGCGSCCASSQGCS
jgi:Fe-S cluster assembly iron-binding protein IscA